MDKKKEKPQEKKDVKIIVKGETIKHLEINGGLQVRSK